MKRFKLEFTEAQLQSMIEMIVSIESMLGCAETDDSGNNWDVQMQKRINSFDRMLKKNGFTRS